MTAVHIVANVDTINLGVWKAALVGKQYLTQHNIESILVSCQTKGDDPLSAPRDLQVLYLPNGTASVGDFIESLKQRGLNESNTIILTHGSWLMPTKVGAAMRKAGFQWIYVPQGMLEPWSMQQKAIVKKLYFRFFENRLVKRASAVRAVSKSERENLQRLFNREISLIHNGVTVAEPQDKPVHPVTFVFMARLHAKKGVVPLVKAWRQAMANQEAAHLIIAGPDEGELEKIRPFLNKNIEYVGPVYGQEKADLLHRAHYYLLPSFSEGFPTSVLEAMSYGAIPLISKGCNFPDVFENDLGYNIEPDADQIAQQLRMISIKPFDETRSMKNRNFIEQNFSEAVIGEKLCTLYASLLTEKK